MAIPKLKKQDVIDTLKFIDENGVPKQNESTRYMLVGDNGKKYPPKYVLVVARKFHLQTLTAMKQRAIWKAKVSPSKQNYRKSSSYQLLPKASSQQMNALQWII